MKKILKSERDLAQRAAEATENIDGATEDCNEQEYEEQDNGDFEDDSDGEDEEAGMSMAM